MIHAERVVLLDRRRKRHVAVPGHDPFASLGAVVGGMALAAAFRAVAGVAGRDVFGVQQVEVGLRLGFVDMRGVFERLLRAREVPSEGEDGRGVGIALRFEAHLFVEELAVFKLDLPVQSGIALSAQESERQG